MSKPDDDTDVPSGLKDDARMERTPIPAGAVDSLIGTVYRLGATGDPCPWPFAPAGSSRTWVG